MGMTVVARELDSEQLASLLADPSIANDLILDEDEDEDEDEDGSDGWLDLDKAWHGVHFLLTGAAWGTDNPLGGAVLGGREVGEDDGYGPPRLLEPDIVREVAEALGVVTDAELRARFDPEEMQRLDIYPQIWEESDILDEYLLPNVQQLRDFYVRAAAHDAAVLIVVQ
ncbi:hypothetical protein ASE25_21585 [Terrabacter sp. Root85]|uniref:YfbM family protein n=1 Tax=Terrabacter sp. Root85 TaxID=1736603 RepID=UPI0006F20730|nr:YfbM family protein [Terrabacter sp. Root85]KRC84421.1 hypothetical protein ASE25_21585 [Terrabacter sp. Root85]